MTESRSNYLWLFAFVAALMALIMAFVFSLPGCGVVKASNVMAQNIPGPSGFSCFAIFDDGKAIGGNCVRN